MSRSLHPSHCTQVRRKLVEYLLSCQSHALNVWHHRPLAEPSICNFLRWFEHQGPCHLCAAAVIPRIDLTIMQKLYVQSAVWRLAEHAVTCSSMLHVAVLRVQEACSLAAGPYGPRRSAARPPAKRPPAGRASRFGLSPNCELAVSQPIICNVSPPEQFVAHACQYSPDGRLPCASGSNPGFTGQSEQSLRFVPALLHASVAKWTFCNDAEKKAGIPKGFWAALNDSCHPWWTLTDVSFQICSWKAACKKEGVA